MKNQYFGDIGDYGKYGLLLFLAEHGITLSVNWYLTQDDGSSDGKFVKYLSDKQSERASGRRARRGIRWPQGQFL